MKMFPHLMFRDEIFLVVCGLPELTRYLNKGTQEMSKAEENVVDILTRFFVNAADGDWEHGDGVVIESLDNPGWRISIDLVDTPYEGLQLKEIRYDNSETDWLCCRVKSGRFEGWGGPNKLPDLLSIFADLVKCNGG